MKIITARTQQQQDDAYFVRKTVFVEEQGVPAELEIDQHDKTAVHIVAYDNERPVGAGRFRIVDGYGKVERVCVLPSHRKDGVGKQLMLKMQEVAKEQGLSKLKLNAQTHAEGFYKHLGYKTVSDEFLDAGMPHVTMTKEL
ncbi:GNAT family N-acetyltransferase [Priestia koreensis]|uniref:GNAT family N-acetyltransferase n=1 Tax=Priestia koreensis TaxID=284581 RepID=UPI003458BBF4